MYLFLFWGERKANVFAGTCPGGWGGRCYLQAHADTLLSGQRLMFQAEAFTRPQGICFGKLASEQRSPVHFAWGV